MPLMMRRCGAFGCPVQGFSGGRCGSSRRHCASVKSPRPTQSIWELRPETSAVCRHTLAEGFTLPTELPLLRLLLVWDNLTGHKNAEMVVWLCQHGVMPLYTPLGGSWLNMAEVVFPQMTKTDLLTTRAGGQDVTDLH